MDGTGDYCTNEESQTEKDKHHMTLLTGGILKNKTNFFTKQTDSQT